MMNQRSLQRSQFDNTRSVERKIISKGLRSRLPLKYPRSRLMRARRAPDKDPQKARQSPARDRDHPPDQFLRAIRVNNTEESDQGLLQVRVQDPDT